ncbi:MAG TPA: NAD(P)/FAD-dependent oxidoreductase [Pseudogracilibacillus sp.]|nr:NAD(P)/FAD-dependent oxidoreductase [Pseudogracilibacillus sp.]
MRDIVIIGAGPAGLSAAISCREAHLNTLVIDEFPKPGGRLLGQLHQEPTGEWWNGILETEKLLDRANELKTDIRTEVSVHHIEKIDNGFIVHTNREQIKTANVLIATGAAEVPAPIPGWTLPGVMSIGAAQVMTNVHRVKVGEKGIVAGVNVLSAAIAREMQLANIDLHSMMLPVKNAITEEAGDPRKVMEGLARIGHLAPSPFLRFGSTFASEKIVQNLVVKFYPKNGFKMWGMPIHIRKAIKQINGTDKVESVTVVKVDPDGNVIPNTEEIVEVDFVCIAGGLYPLSELASVAGCPFHYAEELGGHVPVHNESMETPVDGLYVAGNITGIESAKVAARQGTVAGLSIAKKYAQNKADITFQLEVAKDLVKQTRDDASIQFHPNIREGRKKVHNAFNEQVKP